jgi:hypothetical protein
LGALSGTLTVTKFFVRGSLPKDFRDRYIKSIQLRAFRPLLPDDDTESRAGWCVVSSPLDVELDHESVYYNAYLNLGLRIDAWKLPPALLKAQVEQSVRDHLAKSGRERLSRVERDTIKLRTAAKLKRKLLPAMRHFDFSWNLDAMEARCWSQSLKVHDQLSLLFEQTFGLELVPNSPYIQATQLPITESALDNLSRLDPTPFHTTRRIERPTRPSERGDEEG